MAGVQELICRDPFCEGTYEFPEVLVVLVSVAICGCQSSLFSVGIHFGLIDLARRSASKGTGYQLGKMIVGVGNIFL